MPLQLQCILHCTPLSHPSNLCNSCSALFIDPVPQVSFGGLSLDGSSSKDQPQLDWHQLWQVCICAFSQIWPFCGLSWRVLAFCLKCPVCLYHKQLPLHVLPKFPFLYFNTDTYYCVLSGHEVLCPFHLLVKACSLYFIFACAKLF